MTGTNSSTQGRRGSCLLVNLRLHSGLQGPTDPRDPLPALARMGCETGSLMSAPTSMSQLRGVILLFRHFPISSMNIHTVIHSLVLAFARYCRMVRLRCTTSGRRRMPIHHRSSSTPNGTHLPRIVYSRAEMAPISTVMADQQAAAEPESVLHESSSRGRNGDTKTLLSKGNRESSVPEPMLTGSTSWT